MPVAELVEAPAFLLYIYSMSKLLILCCGVLLFLAGCGETTKESERDETVELSEKRISEISISEFQKTTNLAMKYSESGVVNITFRPNDRNVDARIEYNDKRLLSEVISGKSRIQYLYADGGKRIGIIEGSGRSQIMFEYEGDNIVAQYTILGNDTVGNYQYKYKDGLPFMVEISGVNAYYRTYDLIYTDVPNSLTNFYEMIFPSDLTGQLGIPALYGDYYLKSAIRVDSGAARPQELQETYVPQQHEITFEISSKGKQENLKLTSDGSRQWSAVISW